MEAVTSTGERRHHLTVGQGLWLPAGTPHSCPSGAATTMGYWVHDAEEWRAACDALGPDFADKVRAVFDSDRDEDEMIALVDELYESNGL